MSIIDSSSEDRPIFMIRLVDDSGCSMTGGAAQVGNVGIAVCHALGHQLPGGHEVGARLEEHHDRRVLGQPTWSASHPAPAPR